MTQLHPHGDEAQRNLKPMSEWSAQLMRMHLRAEHGNVPPMSWGQGELQQAHLALHLHEKTPIHEETPVPETANEVSPRILVDRIIAAMAGVDFDRDWTADDGLGPNGRGALRQPYQAPAERLLEWLRRGGLAAIPGYLDLLNQEAVEERDAALAAGRASEAKVRELQGQMREQQRALEDQAGAVAEAESLVHDLEGINNDLRAQLRLLTEERDRLDSQISGVLGAGAEVEADRNRLRGNVRALEQSLEARERERTRLREERDEFQRANSEQARMIHEKNAQLAQLNTQAEATEEVLRRQRDREREQCQRLQRVLAARTRTLREGRTKLRDLVTRLRVSGWKESSVYQELVHILEETPAPEDDGPVSTDPVRVFLGEAEISDIRHITVDTVGRARAAVEIRRSAKAFRADSVMLFTRDAVANMLDRLADDLEK